MNIVLQVGSVNRLGATRQLLTSWRTCRGVWHGVIQRYEIHFKSATRNVHLLPNRSRRPVVASPWYLLTKLFVWSIGLAQLREWRDKRRSSLP